MWAEEKMWSEEKMIRLIDLIREKPVLWNSDLEDYKKRHKRTEAFDEVAARMGMRTDEVERKWKVLQTQYRRELCKLSSGSKEERVTIHWFGYKHLSFLKGRHLRRPKSGHKLQQQQQQQEELQQQQQQQPQRRTINGHEESSSFNSEHSDKHVGDKSVASSASGRETAAPIQEAAAFEKPAKRKLYHMDESFFFDANSDDTICVSDVQSVSDNKRISGPCTSCRSSGSGSRDEVAVYVEHIANKLRRYNMFIRLDVEHKINCVLHEADLKLLQDKLWFQQQRSASSATRQKQCMSVEQNSDVIYEHHDVIASADTSPSETAAPTESPCMEDQELQQHVQED